MGNSLKNSILLYMLERHLRIQVIDGRSNTCSTQHVLWRVVEWLGESFVAVAVAVAVAMGSEF
jgi:hypothetical protein